MGPERKQREESSNESMRLGKELREKRLWRNMKSRIKDYIIREGRQLRGEREGLRGKGWSNGGRRGGRNTPRKTTNVVWTPLVWSQKGRSWDRRK